MRFAVGDEIGSFQARPQSVGILWPRIVVFIGHPVHHAALGIAKSDSLPAVRKAALEIAHHAFYPVQALEVRGVARYDKKTAGRNHRAGGNDEIDAFREEPAGEVHRLVRGIVKLNKLRIPARRVIMQFGDNYRVVPSRSGGKRKSPHRGN